MDISNMNVVKRNGKKEIISFDKITKRISSLCDDLTLNPIEISQKVIQQVKDNIKTSELDEHTANICSSLLTNNLDYGMLADRIIISNNHKNTLENFSDKIELFHQYKDGNNKNCSIISEDFYNFVMLNKEIIDNTIDYKKDYNFDFFGFKTLEKSYLFKIDNKVIERIQDMLMRVSLFLYLGNIEKGLECYKFMSNKNFIHATPTLFNAGTNSPQLLSCFLLGLDDSIDSLFKVNSDCAKISKNSGGIGIDFDKIRCKNSYIRGTNGKSNGIIPFLKVYNETARAVNQGGKRNGSFAIYLQPHHPDIIDFLNLRRNNGNEDERARDLFTALWVSDLFMKRVKTNKEWSLFNPDDCLELSDSYGEEYEKLYLKYEKEKKYLKRLPAREIWNAIITSQIETGTPYILYKDHINKKSNQMNIGPIRSSNLCAEIVEHSSTDEYACCTLGSLSLPSFLETKYDSENLIIYSKSNCEDCSKLKILFKKFNLKFTEVKLDVKKKREKFYMDVDEIFDEPINRMPQIFSNRNNSKELSDYTYIGDFAKFKNDIKFEFNFEKLINSTKVLVNNLNQIIDKNFYPVPETEYSNKKHRPLGLGVQGLADLFLKLKYPFDSPEAKQLNKDIFETIYWAALNKSHELAIEYGKYETFDGSPLSQGKFQFDLWDVKPSDRHNWNELRQKIIEGGVRNSLLVALMPTASTSQILGNNECFEPYTENIYNRRTMAGDFRIINKHLIYDLMELGLWNNDMKDLIIYNDGSIQNIKVIPEIIRNLYKTSWEIDTKVLIDLSIDRAPFVDQTQSLNLFFHEPKPNDLTKALFYGWSKGLKTGCYYIRTRSDVTTQKFTIDPTKIKEIKMKYEPCENCSG